ncbi:MAG: cobalamin-dependent protein, partial [Planctomycetota bacterium]
MSRTIRKIALVQPQQPMPSITPSDQMVLPRYGVPLIATILKNAGYDVTLFVEEIRPINWDIMYAADVVGFHSLTCAVGRARRIVEQLRVKSSAPVVIGGEHATYLPESALRFADYVVRQEGDETILDLLDALATGRDVAGVPGVTFHRDGRTVATPDRRPVKSFETVVDLSTIYGWKEAYTGNPPPYPIMTVQATRGCPYSCKFCPVEVMMGKGYRKRSIDSVIVDLKDKLQYSRQVIFVDNMFDGDLKHAAALLERIIAEKLKPQMTIFCRSSIGKH